MMRVVLPLGHRPSQIESIVFTLLAGIALAALNLG